ncbi:class I SAM-dependent methyltransferase [Agromyces humatus]|nr:class I SAM-dependent methyltransferase [Agromyces humatus]
MNGSSTDRWSEVADAWAATWGGAADAARTALIDAVVLRPGERVLDIGCGSGEFLRLLTDVGATVAGIDPAAGMLDAARRTAASADIRRGDFAQIPWPAGTFDAVVAVNSLQFADDMTHALREAVRVLRPGGRIGIANWAEARYNDIETLEDAVARFDGADVSQDDDYRCEGGLERLFETAGITVTVAGLVPVTWDVADRETLIEGVLLGEPPSRKSALRDVVVTAARPFAVDGGYSLRNAFRFAVGSPG